MSEPRCEWCGGSMAATKKNTCTPKHRAARWRWLNDVRGKSGKAPDAPIWVESPLHGRMGEEARSNIGQVVEEATRGPRSGTNARSGAQISYRKAVGVIAGELLRRELVNPCTETSARIVAETWMRDALSPKQRARLEARHGE